MFVSMAVSKSTLVLKVTRLSFVKQNKKGMVFFFFLTTQKELLLTILMCDMNIMNRFRGSDLSSILFNIYTSDLPWTNCTTLATFAEDTAKLVPNKDPVRASYGIQYHPNLISHWTDGWKIKINGNKLVQINFALNKKGMFSTTAHQHTYCRWKCN